MDLFAKEFSVLKIIVALFVPKGNGTPIHKDRQSHGFAFNIDCTATYRFDSGEKITCRPGDLIYLPKGSNYIVEDQSSRDGGGVYAINFLLASEQYKNKPALVHMKGIESAHSSFSKAAKAWSKKSVGYREECMSELYRIIRLLKIELNEYSPREKNLAVLTPALNYISENYREEVIEIKKLAALSGVSEAYLRRLFHRTFSASPAVYIRNMRINYARELLAAKVYSVTEAASLSGFNDVAYFSREFKKATGTSPSEYQ